jgi:hypothetical protein
MRSRGGRFSDPDRCSRYFGAPARPGSAFPHGAVTTSVTTDGDRTIETSVAARTAGFKYELRALAKETVWLACNRHRSNGQRPIFLFATRRGGSTWLMEVISANRGVKFLDQPFSINTGNLTASQFRGMPKFDQGILIHADAEQATRLESYAGNVVRGDLPVNAPYRFWQRGFEIRSNRLLLKITDAGPMIDWFADRFDIAPVVLTRHPIAQALSCIEASWAWNAPVFLRNQWYVENILGERLHSECLEIARTGSILDRFVLDWALENVVPVRLLPDRPDWTFVSYEECVLHPEATLVRLAEALELGDPDRMLERVARPSRSSRISKVNVGHLLATGEPRRMVERWKETVNDADEHSAMSILTAFGITTYTEGSATANAPI